MKSSRGESCSSVHSGPTPRSLEGSAAETVLAAIPSSRTTWIVCILCSLAWVIDSTNAMFCSKGVSSFVNT